MRLLRHLILDVFLPYLVGHVPARRHPVTPCPQMLAPVPPSQCGRFAQQSMRAPSPQKLYGPGHRNLRRYQDEHMHVVPIDRPSVDRHFQAPNNLPQELFGPQPNVPYQDHAPAPRNPHQVVFAVPSHVVTALVAFNTPDAKSGRPSRRLNARGIRIPDKGL